MIWSPLSVPQIAPPTKGEHIYFHIVRYATDAHICDVGTEGHPEVA